MAYFSPRLEADLLGDDHERVALVDHVGGVVEDGEDVTTADVRRRVPVVPLHVALVPVRAVDRDAEVRPVTVLPDVAHLVAVVPGGVEAVPVVDVGRQDLVEGELVVLVLDARPQRDVAVELHARDDERLALVVVVVGSGRGTVAPLGHVGAVEVVAPRLRARALEAVHRHPALDHLVVQAVAVLVDAVAQLGRAAACALVHEGVAVVVDAVAGDLVRARVGGGEVVAAVGAGFGPLVRVAVPEAVVVVVVATAGQRLELGRTREGVGVAVVAVGPVAGPTLRRARLHEARRQPVSVAEPVAVVVGVVGVGSPTPTARVPDRDVVVVAVVAERHDVVSVVVAVVIDRSAAATVHVDGGIRVVTVGPGRGPLVGGVHVPVAVPVGVLAAGAGGLERGRARERVGVPVVAVVAVQRPADRRGRLGEARRQPVSVAEAVAVVVGVVGVGPRGLDVRVGVRVGVAVRVRVGIGIAVGVGVRVRVAVGVGIGVGVRLVGGSVRGIAAVGLGSAVAARLGAGGGLEVRAVAAVLHVTGLGTHGLVAADEGERGEAAGEEALVHVMLLDAAMPRRTGKRNPSSTLRQGLQSSSIVRDHDAF